MGIFEFVMYETFDLMLVGNKSDLDEQRQVELEGNDPCKTIRNFIY